MELFCYNASYIIIREVINIDRCAYCKKKGTTNRTAIRFWTRGKLKTVELDYCSDSCKQKIHNFAKTHNKYAPSYSKAALMALILFAVVPFSLYIITDNRVWIDVVSPTIMAFIGILLISFPLGLSTLNRYKKMGIKYTTLAIRLTGFLMLITGIDIVWGTFH